jgi:glucose-6-phosphate 1-dehydrogenase
MNKACSDTLVFFGATGDLAYKKVFPALQAMVKRGNLSVPVIGVAKAGWNLEQLKARAKDSLEKHGGLDSAAFEKLSRLLRYVDGDYNDAATFQALRREMASAQRPAHYLAIPPAAFATVVEQLSHAGCTANARVIIEKPFGRDLASARDLNAVLLKTFDDQSGCRAGVRLQRHVASEGIGERVVGAAGQPPSLRRRNGCLRTRARRRDGGRCDVVCP